MNTNQVRDMDRELGRMAQYEATRGGTVCASRDRVCGIFREFKHMVMRGESPVGQLADLVYRKWGEPGLSAGPFSFPGIRDSTAADLSLMPPSEILP